ncbi:MAG TPA: succinyl-diaminopimelate desuccinylase [Acidimicrobiales bacterium]|nr:succinyl-diaminopimelate desuccinylase [Acidimicrobiales bacterium]
MTEGMPDGLFGLATALVAVPSVSHQEEQMADAVEAALDLCPWLTVDRVGNNVVARTDLDRSSRVLLAGHLDTVPPVAGNEEPRIVGDTLYGVGAADMKGGLAVFLHLAGALPEPAVDVTWCFYVCEEVHHRFNGLRHLWEYRPELLEADAAILGEPTGGVVEAGCQGTLRVRIGLEGARAHTARPSAGRNAIHRLAPVLAALATYESRRTLLDGCEYVEQLQAVEVTGGVAGNVVPDEASVVVNHRFAPDRTVEQAEASVRDTLGLHLEPGDKWELVEFAAGAPPALDHPLLAGLVDATGSPPRAKLGWTDAASLWAHGIPAANFGPGDPSLAHTPGEHVTAGDLALAAGVLERFLRAGR